MEGLEINPYTFGGIILTMIAAFLTYAKLSDRRLGKIISDHNEQMTKQTAVVIDALQKDSTMKEKLSQSINELRESAKDNAIMQSQSNDRLTTAFYAIINQQKK